MGFSLRHPELLNARGSYFNTERKQNPRAQKLSIFKFIERIPNSTLTDEDFFPLMDRIESRDYYSKYQVTIVMGGIGAAFRLADHLAMGSAVVLQDFPYQEWFTPYMTPYVDYIPLAMDLSDLSEILHWIQKNPQKVEEIAANGRSFFDRYLSNEKAEEFFYELVYCMAEAKYTRV